MDHRVLLLMYVLRRNCETVARAKPRENSRSIEGASMLHASLSWRGVFEKIVLEEEGVSPKVRGKIRRRRRRRRKRRIKTRRRRRSRRRRSSKVWTLEGLETLRTTVLRSATELKVGARGLRNFRKYTVKTPPPTSPLLPPWPPPPPPPPSPPPPPPSLSSLLSLSSPYSLFESISIIQLIIYIYKNDYEKCIACSLRYKSVQDIDIVTAYSMDQLSRFTLGKQHDNNDDYDDEDDEDNVNDDDNNDNNDENDDDEDDNDDDDDDEDNKDENEDEDEDVGSSLSLLPRPLLKQEVKSTLDTTHSAVGKLPVPKLGGKQNDQDHSEDDAPVHLRHFIHSQNTFGFCEIVSSLGIDT
ncbi:hypothetical protein V1477_001945 [Vespula maculifrons]|uniref:Uncharacterized protein n=1 Tax=Vespula maculifrons TaxID=7453 RepID=A0ABD2CXK4_VESMC